MATISENKSYLEDSTRYPKLQSQELTRPLYQLAHTEYNRLVEYIGQVLAIAQAAVSEVDADLDSESTNPVRNSAVSTAITTLENALKTAQIAPFAGIEESGDAKAQSSSAVSSVTDVYFFEDDGKFGYVTDTELSPFEYYPNWGNRLIYEDDELNPYTDKLYLDVSTQKLYVYSNGGLVEVNKLVIDGSLSSTSTNPIQNKAITAAIEALQKQMADTAGIYYLTTAQNDYQDYVSVSVDDDGWVTITALQDIPESMLYSNYIGIYVGKEISNGSSLQVEGWTTDIADLILFRSSAYPSSSVDYVADMYISLGTESSPTTTSININSDTDSSWILIRLDMVPYADDSICVRLKYTDASSNATQSANAVNRYYFLTYVNEFTDYFSVEQDFANKTLTITCNTKYSGSGTIGIYLGGLVPEYGNGNLNILGKAINTNLDSVRGYFSANPSDYSSYSDYYTFGGTTDYDDVDYEEIDTYISSSSSVKPEWLAIDLSGFSAGTSMTLSLYAEADNILLNFLDKQVSRIYEHESRIAALEAAIAQ